MVFRSGLRDDDTKVNIGTTEDDYWVFARPINYTCRTLRERITEAWAVFTGKCDCLKWTGQ